MDMVEQAAGFGGGDKTQVAGGVMDEIQSRPGGVGSIFSSFQNNGLGGLVQQWAGGQTTPASPDQVEQGLGGTGMIDGVANRLGISPTMAKMGMAVILPMLIHHYVSNGHVTPQGEPTGAPQPEQGGVLQSILSRIL
ncbi:MAG: YidB family protein [Janthinobacterium lividum]